MRTKNVKRALALALVVLAVCLPAFSSVTGGTAGLRTASTEHFDIIYQDKSIETATLLYENCEDIYASLVEFFGADPKLHIPVTVTGETKTLNAYFTLYPANRIVMFDTVSESGTLSVYPQTILYIFRHELTHAFQNNFRGPFVNFLSKVFGDIVSLSPLLYMYPSLSEGGAVLSESVTGYGRINDSYSMQIVKQAKLEGRFPTWLEVAGSRDTYPGGLLYYNFAACFLQYLADTYGIENLATLWVRMGRPGFFETLGKMFRDRIGKEGYQAWEDFYEAVRIPEDAISAKNILTLDQGSYFSPYLSSDGHVYYIHGSTGSLVRLSEDFSESEAVALIPSNETALSISSDGKLALVACIESEKSAVKLYDISGKARLLKRFSAVDPEDDSNYYTYRSGCFVTFEGKEYALLVSNSGQRNSVTLIDLETYEPVEGKSTSFGYDALPARFVGLDDGRVAFILMHEAQDCIAVLDLSSMEVSTIDNPDGIRILSLSKGTDGEESVLSFVWYPSDASSTNLGRYGEIKVSSIGEGCTMELSETDVSGSMGECIRVDDTILFMSVYYESRMLSRLGIGDLQFSEGKVLGSSRFDETMAPGIDTTSLSEASKRYNSLKYFKDGVFSPTAAVSFSNGVSTSALGVQWLTMDPTETFQHTVSLGYGSGNVIGSYVLDWTSSMLAQIRFKGSYGVQDVEGSIGKGNLLLGAGATLSLLNVQLRTPNEYFAMADAYDFEFSRSADGTIGMVHRNVFAMAYQFAKGTGPGVYEVLRFQATARLENMDPGLNLSLRLPRLLWWKCQGRHVTNLPASFDVTAKYFVQKRSFLFTQTLNVTLYSYEIQKGIRIFSLYTQRFHLAASYQAAESWNPDTNKIAFAQKLALSANLMFSPVFGLYLTNVPLELKAVVEMDFNGWKPAFDWSLLTVTLSFGMKMD